jgi:PIN domain nuclease of toxin-antitoxin system
LAGIVLDTHVLLWLMTQPENFHEDALLAIAAAQTDGKLFVSPVTAWELALAVNKKSNPPDIGGLSVKDWFKAAVAGTSSKIVPIGPAIALEAANVVFATGHKDPGDCYILATALCKKATVVSRDNVFFKMARSGFVNVIKC